jgi:hypothetical protein
VIALDTNLVVIVGGFPKHRQKCEEVVASGYQGFALQDN